MTFSSTGRERVKGTKCLKKKTIAKLKFVNWTSKNENIVERLPMSRFLLHLLIHLWTLFYIGIKSPEIEIPLIVFLIDFKTEGL